MFKKLSIFFLAFLVLLSPSAQAFFVLEFPAPNLTNVEATPLTFNASNSETSAISFNLDSPADIRVDILKNGTIIRNLFTSNKYLTAGSKTYVWDGRDGGGVPVTTGLYEFFVSAQNSNGSDSYLSSDDSVHFNIINNSVGNPTTTAPVVTTFSDTPDSFNPTTQNNVITYSLNKAATSTYVVINATPQVTLYGTLINASTNTYTVTWNGQTINGPVLNGTYTYIINATNASGTNTASGTVTVNNTNVPPANTAPIITSFSDTPDPFNPNLQSTVITYSVNQPVTSTNVILSNGVMLSSSLTNSATNTYTATWNGRDFNGAIAGNGTFNYTITANNGNGTGTAVGSVTVSTSGVITGAPIITNLFASPYSFNPTQNQSTTITYKIDNDAYTTLKVFDANYNCLLPNNVTPHRILINNVYKSTGTYTLNWDGKTTSNSILSNGTYTLCLTAVNNSYGTDIKSTTVSLTGGTTSTTGIIKNLLIVPDIFDPYERSTTAYYNLASNAYITVEILNSSGTQIRKLVNNVYRSTSQSYTLNLYATYGQADSWNGRDVNNNIVADGLYQFKITATGTNGQTEVITAYTQVDTDGSVIDFPSGSTCGFNDVSSFSRFCKAIEEMKKLKIFTGYSDGTFRSYIPIARAEAAAVIARALGITRDNTYGYTKFPDVNYSDWYGQDLIALEQAGVIKGYPNGTFGPNDTMNRAELLTTFLRATKKIIPPCIEQPFLDTPVNSVTKWYVDSVCFAKFGLMSDDGTGYFYPASAMTRGDVADLFYQYELIY